MPRVKMDQALRAEMCERLVGLLRTAYDDNWTRLAQRLGYANKSGVQGLKGGTTFLDPQRLALLAEWPTDEGFIPSLTWIIAGKGPALIRFKDGRIDGMGLTEFAVQRVTKGKLR